MTNWTVPKLAIVEKIGNAPLIIADVMMVLRMKFTNHFDGKKTDHFIVNDNNSNILVNGLVFWVIPNSTLKLIVSSCICHNNIFLWRGKTLKSSKGSTTNVVTDLEKHCVKIEYKPDTFFK